MDNFPHQKNLVVIGLGYVGIPLALLAKEKGYFVFGLDISKEKIEKINKQELPFQDRKIAQDLKKHHFLASADFSLIAQCPTVIITVPTPIDKNNTPNLEPVKKACLSIKNNLKRGHLIILESTVNPGVCEEVVKPILEKSGLKLSKDFYLAHCPERINPGDKKWTVRNIPRVLGADSEKGLKKAYAFYTDILEAPIKKMMSLKEAEAVKIVENTFRDINIAFVNELARSFKTLGIDVLNVIEGAKTKPFSFLAHYPSCGVGGHCIPVDPYYLIQRAKENGFDHKFLSLAREINNQMPAFTVELLEEALNEIGKPIKGTKIGLLGLAYKKDIDDLRESPALKILNILKKHGAKVEIFDPFVLKKSTVKSLNELLQKSEALLLATDHTLFRQINLENLKKNNIQVIIDGKNCLDKEKALSLGLIYKGIGR